MPTIIKIKERQADKLYECAEKVHRGAKKLMAEARAIGEQTLQERKQKVDNEFKQSMSILATKHQEEMDQLEAQYDQEMEQLFWLLHLSEQAPLQLLRFFVPALGQEAAV